MAYEQIQKEHFLPETGMTERSTQRLRLLALTRAQMRSLLETPEELEHELNLRIAREMITEPVRRAGGIKIGRLAQAQDQEYEWLTYWLMILPEEALGVGLIGYKGAPDADGMVEVGYGIAPSVQGRGYTTEALHGMLAWAFEDPRTRTVMADVLRTNPASSRVLEKTGMQTVGETEEAMLWCMSRDRWDQTAVMDVLRRFQAFYDARDVSQLDACMELFAADEDGLELIGTNASEPGLDEWCLGRAGVREILEGDWLYWGQVAMHLERARVTVCGDAAWVSAPATVTKILEPRQGYENFVSYMRWVLDEQPEWSAEEKVLDILRGGTNTVFELQKGERFVWPARLTAVLLRQSQGWRFQHMQFSFPTTRFPDVRRAE